MTEISDQNPTATSILSYRARADALNRASDLIAAHEAGDVDRLGDLIFLSLAEDAEPTLGALTLLAARAIEEFANKNGNSPQTVREALTKMALHTLVTNEDV